MINNDPLIFFGYNELTEYAIDILSDLDIVYAIIDYNNKTKLEDLWSIPIINGEENICPYIKLLTTKFKKSKNLDNNSRCNFFSFFENQKDKEFFYCRYPELIDIPCINIIHSSAKISKYAKLGTGNIIGPNVTIGSNVEIENHCLIKNSTCIEKDCKIGSFTKIGSISLINSGCKIESNVSILGGCSISSKININSNSIVGYGAIIMKNIKEGQYVISNSSQVLDQNN